MNKEMAYQRRGMRSERLTWRVRDGVPEGVVWVGPEEQAAVRRIVEAEEERRDAEVRRWRGTGRPGLHARLNVRSASDVARHLAAKLRGIAGDEFADGIRKGIVWWDVHGKPPKPSLIRPRQVRPKARGAAVLIGLESPGPALASPDPPSPSKPISLRTSLAFDLVDESPRPKIDLVTTPDPKDHTLGARAERLLRLAGGRSA